LSSSLKNNLENDKEIFLENLQSLYMKYFYERKDVEKLHNSIKWLSTNRIWFYNYNEEDKLSTEDEAEDINLKLHRVL